MFNKIKQTLNAFKSQEYKMQEYKMQEYELKIRAAKRCIIKELGTTPEFKVVYISPDIAVKMEKHVVHRTTDAKIGVDTTWELVPLKVDSDLRTGSVVYVW